MKRALRWGLGALLGLAGLAAIVLLIGLQLAERKQQRRVDVKVAPLAAAAGSVERGRYLYASRGCAECHGADGGGRVFFKDTSGDLVMAGPQIAPGKASATTGYSTDDWVRIIRHGVKRDGRPALIMPSEDYNRFTDADVAALIAYVRQLPAVDATPATLKLPLPMRVLYGFGAIDDAAAKIDHALPPEPPVPERVSVEHGRYVAQMCIGCHGEHLSGGKVPGGPPEWPPAANLTPGSGSAMTRYPDAASFGAMFKSGKRPDGTPIAAMPFESLAAMSDVDTGALHRYLKSLPPRPFGER